MRMLSSMALLVVHAAFAAAQAGSQMRALDLGPAVRARIIILDLSPHAFVGRIQRADSSGVALALTDHGTGLSIPWPKTTTIERSIGRNQGGAAARGLLVGAAIGAAIYANQIGYARRTTEHGWNVLGLSALSFVIVPGTGALIGMASARERWEPVVQIPSSRTGTIALVLAPSDEITLKSAGGVVRGRFVEIVADSLVVGTTRVAWSDLTDLQIRGGRNRRQGALWGALGLAGGAIYSEIRDPLLSPRERPAAFVANAAVGALLGSLFLGGKGWVSVPIHGLRPAPLTPE